MQYVIFLPFLKNHSQEKWEKNKIDPALIRHFGGKKKPMQKPKWKNPRKSSTHLSMCRAFWALLCNFLSIFNYHNLLAFHKVLWNWASKECNHMLCFEYTQCLLHILSLRYIWKLLPQRVSANLCSCCMRGHFVQAETANTVPPVAPQKEKAVRPLDTLISARSAQVNKILIISENNVCLPCEKSEFM